MKFKTDIIKDNKEITEEYLDHFRNWLKNKAAVKEYFSDKYKATAWNDFDYFNGTIDRVHLVMPTEVSLVDRMVDNEHLFCIGKISKNKENQRFKLLHKVIKSSEMDYYRCGYWLLPEFFVNK